MAGQRGRDVLLKISDGGLPPDYITLMGIRTQTISLSSGAVDGTSADSPEAWRELVAGAGIKTAQVRGSGVFKDAASDARMQAVFFAGEISDWQMIIPDFGILQGPMQVTELSWSGPHDGEAGFTIALESAGRIEFVAV